MKCTLYNKRRGWHPGPNPTQCPMSTAKHSRRLCLLLHVLCLILEQLY